MHQRHFCSGCAFLLVLMIVGVLLAGCESISERRARIVHAIDTARETASGALKSAEARVETVKGIGRSIVGTVSEGAAGVERRIESVEEGVKKIKEGKEMIEEGIY